MLIAEEIWMHLEKSLLQELQHVEGIFEQLQIKQ
jgi:hypothetical protein